MALQGTLDTFALPDVLRLLASTRKTGRLLVRGDRGDGSVWVDGGSVVGSSATGLRRDASAGQVLFELLRYKDGSFTFEAESVCPEPHAPGEVEPLLVDAEHLLGEWKDIAAVVPSLDAWVTLAPTLPQPELTLDQSSWGTIVAVGGGTTVRAIGEALSLAEVEVSRLLRDLVQTGLAEVVAAAPAPVRAAPLAPVEAPAPADAFTSLMANGNGSNGHGELIDLDAPSADLFESDVTPEAPEPAVSEPDFSIEIPGVEPILPPPPPAPARLPEPEPEPVVASAAAPVFADEADEADEVARQLASLSPKAARAVAAAAKAETPEEREAALAEVIDDEDEPINRGLLLKFLSSVR